MATATRSPGLTPWANSQAAIAPTFSWAWA
jgi:hypothetical protein